MARRGTNDARSHLLQATPPEQRGRTPRKIAKHENNALIATKGLITHSSAFWSPIDAFCVCVGAAAFYHNVSGARMQLHTRGAVCTPRCRRNPRRDKLSTDRAQTAVICNYVMAVAAAYMGAVGAVSAVSGNAQQEFKTRQFWFE
jgi:hypothetical protein